MFVYFLWPSTKEEKTLREDCLFLDRLADDAYLFTYNIIRKYLTLHLIYEIVKKIFGVNTKCEIRTWLRK